MIKKILSQRADYIMIEKFSKIEYSKLDKQSLIKILNLYEEITQTDIKAKIVGQLEKETNNFKNEIIVTKIESILLSTSVIKYKTKAEFGDYSIYYYDNYIKIYIKPSVSLEKLYEKINQIDYKDVTLLKTKNKHTTSKKLIFKGGKDENLKILSKMIKFDSQTLYVFCLNK